MKIYSLYKLCNGEWVFVRNMLEAEYRYFQDAFDAQSDIMIEIIEVASV